MTIDLEELKDQDEISLIPEEQEEQSQEERPPDLDITQVSDTEREGDEGEDEMRFEDDDERYSNVIAKEGDDRYKNGKLKQKRISSINNLSQWAHDGKVRAGTRSS